MSSRATSPTASKKRPAQSSLKTRPSIKHMRNDSLTSESATRLLQGTSSAGDRSSPGPASSSKAASARVTKASTVGDSRDLELDADSSDIDEADFGAETFVNYQETTAEKTRMRMLLESFNEDQMARYEVYRRVLLTKANVKRLANNILSQSLPQNIAVVIAGAGKVFVGEIIERARQIQRQRGHSGSLNPEHLREAYRQYRQESGLVPQATKKLFR